MDETHAHHASNTWLFWPVILVVALAVRGWGLGAVPLGATEADIARRAWEAAHGLHPATGPGGWLTAWDAALFFVFGATDGWARAWPALAGGLFPLLALAWQPLWGPRRARGVAVLWAVAPAAVAAARLAWGPALAIAFTWGAWLLYRRGALPWALLLALFAVGAGPAGGWAGLALLWLGWATPRPATSGRAAAWWAAAGVFGLTATAFLRYPAGLGGGAGGWLAWWQGWWAGGGVSPWAGLLYLAPGLAWAGAGLVLQPPRTRQERALVSLALVLLTLWLLYPARQAADLAWVSVALAPWAVLPWLAAARAWQQSARTQVAGVTAALSILSWFAWLMQGLAETGHIPPWLQGLLLVLAGLIAVLLTVLSWNAIGPANTRLAVGLTGLVLSSLWWGVSLRHAWAAAAADEFWQRDPVAADVRSLEHALQFWGERLAAGSARDLPGVLLHPHPTLLWIRDRSFPGLAVRQALMPEERPLVLLADEDAPAGEYRGQAYRLREAPSLTTAAAWRQWFLFHLPTQPRERVVLWIHTSVWATSSRP